SSERLERLRSHECLGLVGEDRRHLMPGLDEQPRQLGRFVGRDAAGYAEQDSCHDNHSALPPPEERDSPPGFRPGRAPSGRSRAAATGRDEAITRFDPHGPCNSLLRRTTCLERTICPRIAACSSRKPLVTDCYKASGPATLGPARKPPAGGRRIAGVNSPTGKGDRCLDDFSY